LHRHQPTKSTRGILVTLLVIPLAALAGILIGAVGLVEGLAAIIVGPAAGWLYAKGAGAPLSRRGWIPFLAISVVGVGVAILAGIVASAFRAFQAVSGDGGLLGPAFRTTLTTVFTSGNATLPVLIGVGLGLVGVFGALRSRTTPTGRISPESMAARDDAAPVTPAPPAAPLPPNTPSPGVILNGEPLDPDAKR
jgi:hypothetical protein